MTLSQISSLTSIIICSVVAIPAAIHWHRNPDLAYANNTPDTVKIFGTLAVLSAISLISG